MKKEHVVSLSRLVSAVAGERLPIVVGSQALYALSAQIPERAALSEECDYLLPTSGSEGISRVRRELGIMSEFQAATDYYADALGRANVVLVPGWEERLIPLLDDEGSPVALCAEVHDICVAKLMAGREKDWPLLLDVLSTGLASMNTFMARAELVQELAERPALLDRLVRFEAALERLGGALDRAPVRQLIRKLRGQ